MNGYFITATLNRDKFEVAQFGTAQSWRFEELCVGRHRRCASRTLRSYQKSGCNFLTRAFRSTSMSSTSVEHVTSTSADCVLFVQLCQNDTANTVACAILSSRLDYCNALLADMSESNMDKQTSSKLHLV